MKYWFFTLIICCACTSVVWSQEENLLPVSPDMMPEFPGGSEKMYNFIFENLHYPPKARRKNITGRVLIKFYLDETGHMQNIEVEESVSPDIDKEALRVVYLMQKLFVWTPAYHEGKNVGVDFVLPIRFAIQ